MWKQERYTGPVPTIKQPLEAVVISATMRDESVTSIFSVEEEKMLQQAAGETGLNLFVTARAGEQYQTKDSTILQTVGEGNIYVTIIGENKDFAGFWKKVNALRAKKK